MPSPARLVQLVLGCVVLGLGVALLLTAELGSDGFSTLVYGTSLAAGAPFVLANLAISAAFLTMAWARGVRPGVGTLVQILLVGLVVEAGLATVPSPDPMWLRVLLVLGALPVLALGIALYLGTHLGAGPMEAAALAWDPPLLFAWSYNSIQLLSAVVGFLLGAPLGLGTVAVVVALGPLVSIIGRALGLDVHQRPTDADLRPS